MAGHIPKPFQRPSVDLGKAKRSWQTVLAQDIQIGDTIPDFGVVKEVWTSDHPIRRERFFEFDNALGKARRFAWDDQVFAFVKEV